MTRRRSFRKYRDDRSGEERRARQRSEMWRACNVALAILALIVFSPLIVLSAVAIKLESPGPVFFRQRRIGLSGKAFDLYKFRTTPTKMAGQIARFTRRPNPPTTVVGDILRQSSVDELPKLFNVLRGDMALVGPRPFQRYEEV